MLRARALGRAPACGVALPPARAARLASRAALTRARAAIAAQPAQIEQLSWAPRAYLYRHFMTRAECEHFITAATPSMAKSTVVDSATGKSVDSQIRTSSGTFLRRNHDEVVSDVERRIAEFSMVPVENGEGVQILRYEKGQKYEAHYDYFHDRFNADPAKGGQRVATLLMYLTDVEEGGEVRRGGGLDARARALSAERRARAQTVFPSSQDKPHAGAAGGEDGWSSCAQRGVAVKPRQGDALLFFSLDLEQRLDTASLHAGCPVIRGVKWSATKWMHVGSFGAEATRRKGCADYHDSCAEWARAGECTRNAAYMTGSDGSAGECLKSCNKCASKT